MASENRTKWCCHQTETDKGAEHRVEVGGRWRALGEVFHEVCDKATGAILIGMVIFGPWAFGTTQEWAIRVMNAGGYMLGGILLVKGALRRATGFRPARWGDSAGLREVVAGADGGIRLKEAGEGGTGVFGWLIRGLGVLTFLILAYCLVSAVNARSTLTADFLQLEYRDCVRWLPHSYDAGKTWEAFWKYLGLAAVFWATRDWLMVKSRTERDPLKEEAARTAVWRGCLVPRRLELLLWVVCVNGALLAAQGLLQRGLGGGKLLWLVEPQINKSAESQFGPYAYRSNAAQYFLLAWPLAVGLWWLLRHRARQLGARVKTYNNLLPCILVMAVAPLMSLSRAGAVIGGLSLLIVLGLVLARPGKRSTTIWGIVGLLAGALLLGIYMEWQQLDSRFRQEALSSPRFETWQNTWQIVREFPVFGTGPGTFSSVYQWYRPSVYDEWYAFAHNDWLETLMSFGAVGTSFIVLAFVVVVALRFAGKGIGLHSILSKLIYVAVGSCLLYAAVDFPLQVHSVLFLLLLECAILSCLSRAVDAKKTTGS